MAGDESFVAISGRGAGQNGRFFKRFADIHLSRHAAELKKVLDNRWVISIATSCRV